MEIFATFRNNNIGFNLCFHGTATRVDFAFFRAVRFFDSTIDMSQSPVTQFAVQRRDIETSLCTLSLSSCSIDNVKVKVLKSEDKFEVVKIMYISRIIITLNTVNDA